MITESIRTTDHRLLKPTGRHKHPAKQNYSILGRVLAFAQSPLR